MSRSKASGVTSIRGATSAMAGVGDHYVESPQFGDQRPYHRINLACVAYIDVDRDRLPSCGSDLVDYSISFRPHRRQVGDGDVKPIGGKE